MGRPHSGGIYKLKRSASVRTSQRFLREESKCDPTSRALAIQLTWGYLPDTLRVHVLTSNNMRFETLFGFVAVFLSGVSAQTMTCQVLTYHLLFSHRY